MDSFRVELARLLFCSDTHRFRRNKIVIRLGVTVEGIDMPKTVAVVIGQDSIHLCTQVPVGAAIKGATESERYTLRYLTEDFALAIARVGPEKSYAACIVEEVENLANFVASLPTE